MDPCPKCQSDLDGAEIPEEDLHLYVAPGEDISRAPRTYSRKIGIEERDIYDGILVWLCPDCRYMWPRFDAPDWRHNAAVTLIREWGP